MVPRPIPCQYLLLARDKRHSCRVGSGVDDLLSVLPESLAEQITGRLIEIVDLGAIRQVEEQRTVDVAGDEGLASAQSFTVCRGRARCPGGQNAMANLVDQVLVDQVRLPGMTGIRRVTGLGGVDGAG